MRYLFTAAEHGSFGDSKTVDFQKVSSEGHLSKKGTHDFNPMMSPFGLVER